jgi:hypothetical protein
MQPQAPRSRADTRPPAHLPPSPRQPYLANHNPRTFEDLDKPIPNFKKFGLKAGEVPKFFDNVLQVRAGGVAAVAAAARSRGSSVQRGQQRAGAAGAGGGASSDSGEQRG